MNLYRLDYLSPDGSTEPVCDPFWRNGIIRRSASIARADAIQAANETGGVVQVTRISGAGQMKPTLIACGETGRCHRPKS